MFLLTKDHTEYALNADKAWKEMVDLKLIYHYLTIFILPQSTNQSNIHFIFPSGIILIKENE